MIPTHLLPVQHQRYVLEVLHIGSAPRVPPVYDRDQDHGQVTIGTTSYPSRRWPKIKKKNYLRLVANTAPGIGIISMLNREVNEARLPGTYRI